MAGGRRDRQAVREPLMCPMSTETRRKKMPDVRVLVATRVRRLFFIAVRASRGSFLAPQLPMLDSFPEGLVPEGSWSSYGRGLATSLAAFLEGGSPPFCRVFVS
jgi:hypothetical protein